MSAFSPRKQELEHKITDLEATLHNLKQELREQVEVEQHDAINHLEDYLEQVDHKYANMREFLELVLSEVRALFQDESHKDRGR